MNWTVILIAAIMFLSCFTNAQSDAYYAKNPYGAPMPINPISPDALGLQLPQVSASFQAPSPEESSLGLIKVNPQSAYVAPPQGFKATATSPSYDQVIVPPGGYAPNNLYVLYAPQTVAGCYLYANLPLWIDVTVPGDIWLYEWYQSGYVDIKQVGYAYNPGWFKRWFFADVPGWHVLQFYCKGWSNYVYIYVYSSGNYEYWVAPPDAYSPTPLPYALKAQDASMTRQLFSGNRTHLNFLKYKGQ
jgi:hypothetical protein